VDEDEEEEVGEGEEELVEVVMGDAEEEGEVEEGAVVEEVEEEGEEEVEDEEGEEEGVGMGGYVTFMKCSYVSVIKFGAGLLTFYQGFT
jgi:hypothetical protein